jgi:hypothetical protein
MTDRDIADRRANLDKMEVEIHETYGDNESMRAAYESFLRTPTSA